MTDNFDIQKELATAQVALKLGSAIKAKTWMQIYREEFQGRTALEMIDAGLYDKVLEYISKVESNAVA